MLRNCATVGFVDTIALILPLFILIALGYVLKKTRFLSEGFIAELNRLVYYIALPAMLFGTTTDQSTLPPSFGATAAVYSIAVIAVTMLAIVLSTGRTAALRGSFVQASFRANLAYLGLPIVSGALGNEVIGIIAVIIAVGVILHTVLSVVTLRILDPTAQQRSVVSHLAHIVTNPLIIAIVLGLLVAGAGIELPAFLRRTIDVVASMSLPVILIIVGFSLSFTSIGRSIVPAAGATVLKLVIMPLIAWALGAWVFGTTGDVLRTIVLMSAMPTAIVSQTFARQFNASAQLASATVSLDTLLALLSLPIWIAVLA